MSRRARPLTSISPHSDSSASAAGQRSAGQRGEGRLGLLLWLAVVILGGMIAYEAIPVRIRVAQLQDFMIEATERARFHNAESLRKNIVARAQELELPVGDEDVQVVLGSGQIKIDAAYTMHLEFPFYTYVWNKEHHIDRPVFYW